jgi:hypothetical protein
MILTKCNFARQILIKVTNIKFHEIRPVQAEFDTCGRTEDMMKTTSAFRAYEEAPENDPSP